MMNREENSDSIPIDLLVEIFSRLPAKSILRFRCVSRLWRSILHCQYFTDLFLIRSSARPRILFAIQTRVGDNEWNFFSSHQPHNPYETSSLIGSADFCLKLPKGMSLEFGRLTSGFIHTSKQEGEDQMMHLIFNPSTGQFRILPYHKMHLSRSFLGFDPIDKQYKVLCINMNPYEDRHDCGILTVEHGEIMWRKIHCPLIHYRPRCEWVCIDGVLYYFAGHGEILYTMIVCFDVRFEKFKFIDAVCDWPTRLVNYKSKLGVIKHNKNLSYKTELWVLEDVDKQKWSHYVSSWPENEVVDLCYFSFAGVTSTGEIVFSSGYKVPFYVCYFNLERKILHRVEIQGVGEYLEDDTYRRVYVFVDYLEGLHFNIMRTRYAPISIRPLNKICRPPKSTPTLSKKDHHRKQEPRTFESINKFDALRLLDADDE